jgi:4-hydroxy-tetrahydrodipicolinate reductase
MKIGITGCKGRMGALLVQEIKSGTYPDLTLAGGTALPADLTASDFFITDNADILFQQSDCVIDFTIPDATRQHMKLAVQYRKPLIIGTTGLSAEDEQSMRTAARDTRIVYAANYSVGVNVLLSLVEKAASALVDDWDIEIFEAHHKHKIDAPSGTALALGKAAAKGRQGDLAQLAEYARHGETGARKKGSIGFSVARGGDVVGEHSVHFYGEGERVTLSHSATNRALFARGALRAAAWAHAQPNGLYSMKDVLGL